MKTKLILAISLTLVLMTNCQSQKDNPDILKQILFDYFDGIKNQDLDKLNSLTTEDFVLFEDGKIWTNDSLVDISNSFEGVWTLDNMKIHIDQSSGDITYHNHGEFVINDTIEIEVDWLESATFRKLDNKWKMNFLHSTVRK